MYMCGAKVWLGLNHKVHIYRVPQCMSPRRNWDSPTPSRVSECAPPPVTKGGAPRHTRLRGRGRPNYDDWRKSIALCVLCESTSIIGNQSILYLSRKHLGSFLAGTRWLKLAWPWGVAEKAADLELAVNAEDWVVTTIQPVWTWLQVQRVALALIHALAGTHAFASVSAAVGPTLLEKKI